MIKKFTLIFTLALMLSGNDAFAYLVGNRDVEFIIPSGSDREEFDSIVVYYGEVTVKGSPHFCVLTNKKSKEIIKAKLVDDKDYFEASKFCSEFAKEKNKKHPCPTDGSQYDINSCYVEDKK